MGMKLIGVTGFARSGKDTVASYLVRTKGFTKIAFADPMREFLYAVNPLVGARVNGTEVVQIIRLREIIYRYGWDGYKQTEYGTEIRELLQRLGTEAGRAVLGDSVWMDEIQKRIDRAKGDVVISDVRFVDECDFIRQQAGVVIRVNRPRVTSVNGHVSDQRLPDATVDFEVENSGSIEDLQAKIKDIVDTWQLP
jgi:hypothetical protein